MRQAFSLRGFILLSRYQRKLKACRHEKLQVVNLKQNKIFSQV